MLSKRDKLSGVSVGVRVTLALLFLLFTATQFNDPDPLLWISIYGTIAILSLSSIFYKIPDIVIYIISALLVVYLAVLIPEIISWIRQGMPSIVESMKAEEPHIEYTREFFGIIICLATLFYLRSSK